MEDVWNGIKEGAEAYLASQWKIIRITISVLVVALFLSVWLYNHLLKPMKFSVIMLEHNCG